MPASERLTVSTWPACSATGRLRCSTPMPPARAMAMAIRASVTVSIAELTSGTRSRISRVSWLEVSACRGHHVGRGGQQQDVVEGQPEHRDLGRIVAAGRHRNGDGNAAFSDRHGWSLQTGTDTVVGTKKPSYRHRPSVDGCLLQRGRGRRATRRGCTAGAMTGGAA